MKHGGSPIRTRNWTNGDLVIFVGWNMVKCFDVIKTTSIIWPMKIGQAWYGDSVVIFSQRTPLGFQPATQIYKTPRGFCQLLQGRAKPEAVEAPSPNVVAELQLERPDPKKIPPVVSWKWGVKREMFWRFRDVQILWLKHMPSFAVFLCFPVLSCGKAASHLRRIDNNIQVIPRRDGKV